MTIICHLFTYRMEVSRPRVERAFGFVHQVHKVLGAPGKLSSENVLLELQGSQRLYRPQSLSVQLPHTGFRFRRMHFWSDEDTLHGRCFIHVFVRVI